jgi:exodeoxyribonuclease VII large subunit
VLSYARRGMLSRQSERVLREPVMRMDEMRQQMTLVVRDEFNQRAGVVRDCRLTWKSLHPAMIMMRRKDRLEQLAARLEQVTKRRLEMAGERLVRLGGLVKALGPESAFERGFSITFGPDGKLVRGPEDVKSGDELETMTKGGVIASKVD